MLLQDTVTGQTCRKAWIMLRYDTKMWSLLSLTPLFSKRLPHVISRMGSSDVVDVNLFCLVAMDFYRHQIDEELDRRAFQSVFETVASPGSPYFQLLSCLQSIHQDKSLWIEPDETEAMNYNAKGNLRGKLLVCAHFQQNVDFLYSPVNTDNLENFWNHIDENQGIWISFGVRVRFNLLRFSFKQLDRTTLSQETIF